MNKIQYGNRTLYEKNGGFLKYLDGMFMGETTIKDGLNWLRMANPYKLETSKIPSGFKARVRDATSGHVVAENCFIRGDKQTDNDVWKRLLDWSERYIGERGTNNEGNNNETVN